MGSMMPVEASDFAEKSSLFLPKEAQYSYLVNLLQAECNQLMDTISKNMKEMGL